MSVEIHSRTEAVVFANPGKRSVQLLWRENAPDAAVTVTRVAMEPGALSPRHDHPGSEQIWIVESGVATLLLGEHGRREIKAGDLVRTPKGHVHGIENTGAEPFVYLTVTCPPEDMTRFYGQRHDATATSADADPVPTEVDRDGSDATSTLIGQAQSPDGARSDTPSEAEAAWVERPGNAPSWV